MQFLYPNVLWGLLAVAVPLIIHLFNFRRTKKVFFTNVKFLKTVETETSSFRKLKQWLIMAARMAFIAALVLAFAQPILPAKNATNDVNRPTVNSIYIDNSLSMQNTTENQRYLDLAVIKIDELLTLFKQSPTVQLLTNDFTADDQVVTNAARIKDRLTTLQFSTNARPLSDVSRRQSSLVEKHNANAIVQRFLFSDFQKSTAGNLKDIKLDSTEKLFLIPVRGEATQNVFVDSVWLASPFIREMQNNIVYAQLRNAGDKTVEKLPIQLYIDEAQSSTASVDIAPNGSAVASFNFTVRDRGVHRGKITFDDQPITFDNDYFFVINASPTVNVLHLYQERSSANYIEKLYNNDSLFNYRSNNALNADVGLIKSTDLLILESVERIEGSLKSSVEDFLRTGGSVVFIPSSNPNELSYRNFLSGVGVQGFSLLKSPVQEQSRLPISELDKTNPFFDDVFERTTLKATVEVPSMQPVLTWSATSLLSFRNQRVFMSQNSVGAGTFYLLASPLDSKYGNFAEHPFYVPTFVKVAARSTKPEPSAYSFNQRLIRLNTPNVPKNAVFKLKNGTTEIIPLQRIHNNTLIMELPKSAELPDNQQLESGYYELTLDGKIERLIALNHENNESEMAFYSPEELREAFAGNPNVTVFDNLLDGDFVQSFADNNLGKSLWKYFIYAALAFLLIEISLVRFLKG
jgi:hypothetical protein